MAVPNGYYPQPQYSLQNPGQDKVIYYVEPNKPQQGHYQPQLGPYQYVYPDLPYQPPQPPKPVVDLPIKPQSVPKPGQCPYSTCDEIEKTKTKLGGYFFLLNLEYFLKEKCTILFITSE